MSMDRKIERPQRNPVTLGLMGGGVAVALIALYLLLAPQSGRTLEVQGERLTISRVESGNFEDFIPVRAKVAPLRTTYLDTVEGGRVESLHVEDGAQVEVGQLLVALSNTNLQLSVMSLEAEVTEQLNRVHDLELSLEQTRLENKKSLAEIQFRLKSLKRQVDRRRKLHERGNVSAADLADTEDEYVYFRELHKITVETQETKERIQRAQFEQLQTSAKMLRNGLKFARGNLDRLNIKAPIAGRLTGLDVEIGQSLAQGERLGQIDDPTKFKVEAQIDEFYLDRVSRDQIAHVALDGGNYVLRITKIYPQVSNGQFQADLVFEGDAPANIRRGQTLQLRLTLGDPVTALLIPYGAFYQDTGGNWIFVVSSDGSVAVRRDVKLGRHNPRSIEVLSGLEEGEEVITSPYRSFLDMDRLELGS